MKAIIIIIVVLLNTAALFGQTDRQNLEKYWYLKKQLNERFLRVGWKAGYNIPAGNIKFGPEEYWNTSSPVNSRIRWGDGTIHLGWYIGVLATEYKLLKDHNLSTTKTVEELFLALETINRLDRVAEKVWNYYSPSLVPLDNNDHSIPDDWEFVQDNLPVVPYNTTTNAWDPTNTSTLINGFIIRDDIPATILNDFSYPYTSMSSSMSRPIDAEWLTNAPYGYKYNNYMSNQPPANEMSQDQLFALFLGLVLAREYSSDATYFGINVGDYAASIGTRLLNYYTSSWILRNPVRNKQVMIGGDSFFFSSSLNNLKNYFASGTKNYASLQLPVYGPASGNSVNRALSAIIISISNSATPLILNSFTKDPIGWEFYSLLNNTIYGHSNNYYPLSDLKSDLNSCPCRGPYKENIQWTPDHSYMTNGVWTKIHPNGIPTKWNTGNCLTTAETEAVSNRWDYTAPADGAFESWFSEQYNGLDYMLLYNLYRINYDSQDNYPYTDLRDAMVSGSIPVGSQGTTSNIRIYNSFGNLTSDIKLLVPSNNLPAGAEMYAGNSIRLIPGFSVANGATFNATIHQDNIYSCASGTYKITSVENPGRFTNRTEINVIEQTDNLMFQNKLDNAVEQKRSGGDIIVYPNPCTDYFVVDGLQGEIADYSINITDSYGRKIVTLDDLSSNRIDMSSYLPGTYSVSIYNMKTLEIIERTIILAK